MSILFYWIVFSLSRYLFMVTLLCMWFHRILFSFIWDNNHIIRHFSIVINRLKILIETNLNWPRLCENILSLNVMHWITLNNFLSLLASSKNAEFIKYYFRTFVNLHKSTKWGIYLFCTIFFIPLIKYSSYSFLKR